MQLQSNKYKWLITRHELHMNYVTASYSNQISKND